MKPNSAADAPIEMAADHHRAQQEPADRRHHIKNEQARRPVHDLDLRAQVHQHPAIHQNVQEPAVQESRRDQPPPLVPLPDRPAFLGPECIEHRRIACATGIKSKSPETARH